MMKIKSNKYTKYAIMQLSKAYLHVVWVFFFTVGSLQRRGLHQHYTSPLSAIIGGRQVPLLIYLSTSRDRKLS